MSDWPNFTWWVANSFPNADTNPVVIIPWGEEEGPAGPRSGLMVDTESDVWRVGVYLDLYADDAEWLALLECPTRGHTQAALDYLTDEQPEGTDWTAWAAQRVQDWDWLDFFVAPTVGALLAQLEDVDLDVALAAVREVLGQLELRT